ncbi:hypothetical protein HK096_009166 [Nowakowskiella sp. JEL0078]|nr:hypothetical protein HK096_009166 [Nowakowskiella sp. JEL0078]
MKIRDLLNEDSSTSDCSANSFSNFNPSEQLDLYLPVSGGPAISTRFPVYSQHFASDSSQFRPYSSFAFSSTSRSTFQNYPEKFTFNNLEMNDYNSLGSFQYKQLSPDSLEPVTHEIPLVDTTFQTFEPLSSYSKGQEFKTPEHNETLNLHYHHWFNTTPSESRQDVSTPGVQYTNDYSFISSPRTSANSPSSPNEEGDLLPRTKTSSATRKSAPTAKLFKCPHPGCDEGFTRRQNLRSHQGRHTGVRDFKCTENGCGSAFRRRQELLRHARSVHSPKDQRPFVCTSGCGRTFARADALKRHLESTKSKLGGCAAVAAARILSVHVPGN